MDKNLNFCDMAKQSELYDNNYVSTNFHGVPFRYRESIGLSEMLSIVQCVSDSVIEADGTDYTPHMFEIALYKEIIETYTDIVLPEDIQEAYEFILNSRIMNHINTLINQEQIEAIVKNINNTVDYRQQMAISSQTKRTEELSSQYEFALQSIEELIEQMKTFFSGIDGESVRGFVDVIHNELPEAVSSMLKLQGNS